MLKPTMLKQPVVRKDQEQEEDRGEKAPVLLAVRTGLVPFLGRLGKAGRGYALAGAGVVAAAVVFVSLLSWLAPDSDRPIASPLEAVGRVAGDVIEQVDDQVQALLGTDGDKTILRSLGEGIATASSLTPSWPSGKSVEVAASPSTTGPGGTSSSEAPTRGGGYFSSASEGAPTTSSQQQPASSLAPSPSSSGTSEAPTTTADVPSSSPTAYEPSAPPPSTEEPSPPATEEPPPTAEEPSPPPAQKPPAAEEPAPPPLAQEPAPPAASDSPPSPEEGPPGTIADE